MKKIVGEQILLSKEEAREIAALLETLEGMAGSLDEHFTTECKTAGRWARQIRKRTCKKEKS